MLGSVPLFATTGSVEDIGVRGDGTVHIVSGNRVSFDGEGNLDLVLEPGNVIEEASGKVGSLVMRDAIITSDGDAPLAPVRIVEAEGAEIDGVDLTQLNSIASIQSLRSAHRVVPAMPSKFDELTDIAKAKPPEMTVDARQVFWAQGERPSTRQYRTAQPTIPTTTEKTIRFPTPPRCAQTGRVTNKTPVVAATAPSCVADTAQGSRQPAMWPMITGWRSACVYE